MKELRRQVAERVARLSQLTATVESTTGQPTAVAAAAELKLLRALDLVYLHHQTALAQIEETREERDQLHEENLGLAAAPPRPGQTYSWLDLEDCRDRLDAEVARINSRSKEVEAGRTALEAAIAERERYDRQRRKVIDEAAVAPEEERARFEYRRRLADLESLVASSTVDLRRTELALKKLQQETTEAQRLLLTAQVDRMRPRAVFTEDELKQRRQALAAYVAEIEQRLEQSQQKLNTVDKWISTSSAGDPGSRPVHPAAAVGVASPEAPSLAREIENDEVAGLLGTRLRDSAASIPKAPQGITEDTTASSPSENSHHQVRDSGPAAPPWSLETMRFVRRLCHEQVLELERRLADFQLAQDSALHRFKFFNGTATEDELTGWKDGYGQLVDHLDEEEVRLSTRIGELLQDLATLHREARLKSGLSTGDESLADLAARTEYLESLLRTLEFSQRHILAVRRAAARFVEDMHERSPEVDPESWLAVATEMAETAWDYELIAVGDEPITVGKITRGLLGFLVGLFVAAVMSRLLGRRLLPRVGLNHGAAEAFRTLTFYSLCVVFGILSLELANVPLTAFTFLGGAAAIGVGFGSQNILNNFISGLILLAEQPIRVGDLVELGTLHGTIERIGTRSTTVRTGANVEIVVPNSRLLEDNVTNLTRSDNRFRTSVAVGVAYGSPIAEVKHCLKQAARHPEILATPEPFVIFSDFAESSLNFEVHFWVRISSMTQCRRIASDVREAIDEAFRRAGIVMAFPQRDLHLDSGSPLEIRLLRQQAARVHKAA